MISLAPRFFNFRRTASRTMDRNVPSKGKGAVRRSTTLPSRIRPRCCSPSHLAAASWASGQLNYHRFASPSRLNFSQGSGTTLYMQSRSSDKIPGARAWLHHINQYPLPGGVPDRLSVTLVSVPRGLMEEAVVQTEAGEHLTVRALNIETPSLFLMPGKASFSPESAPEMLDALQARLTAERGKVSPHGVEPDHAAFMDHLEWVLRRNGREPLP